MRTRKSFADSAAAQDLGLTDEAKQDYKRRLSLIFAEGCVILGTEATAKLFREKAALAPKMPGKRPPPQKRKGAHDPAGDLLLVQLWKACKLDNPSLEKLEFARFARGNHQHTIEPKSLVRRLNRALARERETIRLTT